MISIVNISGKYDHVAKCSVALYGQNDTTAIYCRSQLVLRRLRQKYCDHRYP